METRGRKIDSPFLGGGGGDVFPFQVLNVHVIYLNEHGWVNSSMDPRGASIAVNAAELFRETGCRNHVDGLRGCVDITSN